MTCPPDVYSDTKPGLLKLLQLVAQSVRAECAVFAEGTSAAKTIKVLRSLCLCCIRVLVADVHFPARGCRVIPTKSPLLGSIGDHYANPLPSLRVSKTELEDPHPTH